MYSLSRYNNANINLAKSITFKFFDLALHMNRHLSSKYKISSDKKTWKYFLNISGQKHPDNQPISVLIIELGEQRELTKENLEKYKYTRTELLKYDTLYKTLINNYPNELLYINGCISPVDIDTAIQAKDGTILSYNKNILEENEYNVIKEIETYIQGFLTRWHIKEYALIDELYIPSVIAVLYANLPNKINNIRMNNIFTNKVHPFHLENYFASKLSILDEINNLNNKSKYWLYKNIQTLINNAGRNDTLNTIVKEILTENNIGIGTYVIRKPNDELNTNPSPSTPSYSIKDLKLDAKALNDSYSGTSTMLKTVDNILNLELDMFKDVNPNVYTSDVTLINKNKFKNKTKDNHNTKVLEITTYQLFRRQGTDLFKLIFEYWAHGVENNMFNYIIEYIEPNDNRVYLVQAKHGLLLLIKAMLYLVGRQDALIQYAHYYSVLNMDKDIISKKRKYLIYNGYSEPLLDDLQKNYPSPDGSFIENYTSNIYFHNQIKLVSDYLSYYWIRDANANNSFVSSNLKLLANLITISGSAKLSEQPESIDNILANNNIVYEYTEEYDPSLSINAIISSFLNIQLDEYATIEEFNKGFKDIVTKLTAYTTQTLINSSDDDSINMYYNTPSLTNSKVGILSLDEAKFRALEENYAKLKVDAINFTDTTISNIINLDTVLDYSVVKEKKQESIYTRPKVKGKVEIYGEVNKLFIEPVIDGMLYSTTART